jgi:ABC-type multidrug transport system fused ATPase/permease subunit
MPGLDESQLHFLLLCQGVSEAYVSISRIQNYLEHPERPEHDSSRSKEGNVTISMEDVTCHWNHVEEISKSETKEAEELDSSLISALSKISIAFQKGQLTCIIGTVGCGKSALLQAIVGELPVYSGTVQRSYKTLAYAAQDPWIMDGTVKDNITLGSHLDPEWYDTIVDACGLRLDFSQFANGDQTIVGDRGIQCSGGQRARIGLARALYRDADVLVADDPLSAVDAQVGRQLFNEAIMNLGVKRGKSVILTTHQHQYVHNQRCVLVAKGRIEKIGSYSECIAAAGGKLTAHAADDAVDTLAIDQQSAPSKSEATDHYTGVSYVMDKVSDDSKEDLITGDVRFETFINYTRAMGGLWVAGALFILFTITQVSVLVTVAFMGRWAERPAAEQNSWDILGLVIGLTMVVIVLASFRAVVCFYFTIEASKKLHDGMTKAVLRAPISFFDTNPLGRVLNRFSAVSTTWSVPM